VFCAYIGGNDTETTSSTTEIPLVSNRTTEWEKRVLFNFLIVGLVVLVIVGAIFITRYMRTEKKTAKRKYERLRRAEEDNDIELSIYEKK
jgi:large-conductance mechanosensitive channel